MMIGFNGAELRQDLGLGIAFIFLTVFSSLRILRSFSSPNGRKVITTFNSLIFISALSRAVWFLIPNYFLEGSYIPSAVVAYESPKWLGALISELLLAIGSLSLYGVFILVACYWIYMLTKLNSPTAASYDEVAHRNRNGSNMSGIMSSGSIGSSSSNGTNGRSSLQNLVRHRWATLELFGIAMAVAVSLQVLGVCLFLNQTFNSQQMVMYDSVLLSVLSLSIVITITLLSQHIKTVLQNLEAMNNRNSQPQIRRIFAIIIVANVFFVTRVILELTLTICFAVMMKEQHSFEVLLSDRYWSLYICVKHSCEVVVLALELLISSAVKSYDNSRGSVRQQQQQHQQYHQQQQQPPSYGAVGNINPTAPQRVQPPRPFVTSSADSGKAAPAAVTAAATAAAPVVTRASSGHTTSGGGDGNRSFQYQPLPVSEEMAAGPSQQYQNGAAREVQMVNYSVV